MTGSTNNDYNQRPASSQNNYGGGDLRLADSENKYLQQRTFDIQGRGTPTNLAARTTPDIPASSDPYAPSLVYDLL